jgi:hypothetical protein
MSRLGNMLRSFNNSNALVVSGSQATDSVGESPPSALPILVAYVPRLSHSYGTAPGTVRLTCVRRVTERLIIVAVANALRCTQYAAGHP